MPSRAFMLAWRMPSLLRPIMCMPPSAAAAPATGRPRMSFRVPPVEKPDRVYDSETASAARGTVGEQGPGNHPVLVVTFPERMWRSRGVSARLPMTGLLRARPVRNAEARSGGSIRRQGKGDCGLLGRLEAGARLHALGE